MNKQEFLARLRRGLSSLPQEEMEEHLTFYDEMIDDRMEEGLTEEEAVQSIGSVEALIGQILLEHSEEKPKNRRLKTWEIVLLLLGIPVWVPILSAVVSVVGSVYIGWWSILISLWAVFGSMVGCAVGTALASIVMLCKGNMLPALAMFGSSLVCAGGSIFLFYACLALTKGTVELSKKSVLWVKHFFTKKEAVE